jgi:repressor LexA
MGELTSRRRQILEFIRTFVEDKGYSPTVRDIGKGCGISSPAAVQRHLDILKEEGYIRREPEVFRSISIIDEGNKGVTSVPLLGTISAGKPIPVPNSDTWAAIPEETLRLPEDLTQGKDNTFALKVKGTSMLDALIDDGDIILMEQANTANDGEMVALWLKDEQEVTLKQIYRDSGKLRLQPANKQMTPIYQDPDNVEIQGKIIGVIRKLR